MAVSGSTDFSLTAASIVEQARALLGIAAAEEPLSASDLQSGLTALNLMLKTWQTQGVKSWTLTEGTLALVQGTASYAFGSGGAFTTIPLDITQVRINRGSNDLEMIEISREDYYRLPNKAVTGYPTQWFYDRQRAGGTLYVWPAPDTTAGTLKFTYRRRIMDFDQGTDDIDLPQEWHEAVIYGLAVRMMPLYGPIDPATMAEVRATAAEALISVRDFDIGESMGSITVMPDMNRGR